MEIAMEEMKKKREGTVRHRAKEKVKKAFTHFK